LTFGRLGTALVFGVAVLLLPFRVHSQTASQGLHLSPAKIDFGEAAVGSENPPRTITLSNATKSSITMEQIITSGIDFSQKNDCGQTLAPGVQCTIQVFFKPATSGARIGNLDVMGSDPASPHFIALNGIGI
jgi:Transmembrane protein 131-like N-terminal